MRKKLVAIFTIVAFILTGSAIAAAQQPMTPLEEAVAKIRPAVGTFGRWVIVNNEKGEFIKNQYENAGTLTVIASNSQFSCVATTAHGLAERDAVLGEASTEITLPDKTKKVVREIRRFSGDYHGTFDGESWIRAELIAKRGGEGQQEDFAVLKFWAPNLPKIELGDVSMVRQATEIFMVHSMLGLTHTFTHGYVAREFSDPFPTVGTPFPLKIQAYLLDIKMAPGSSGGFAYVLRGNTGYAFAMLSRYLYVGAASGGQIADNIALAIDIARFKKFIADEKILDQCK